jgi:hypothetical protein
MATTIGLILTVAGKSNNGHSRIGQDGKQWQIEKVQRNVNFDTRNGEWVFIRSLLTGERRWMLLNQDSDFTVIGAM